MENHDHNLHPEREQVDHRVIIETNNHQTDKGGIKKQKLQKKAKNPGRIFLALIIIIVGLLYLASNFRLIEELEFQIWQLWPVLLIFAGLSILSVRGVLGVLTGTLVAIATLGLIVLPGLNLPALNNEAKTSNFQVPQQVGATDAIVVLQYGAGSLTVTSADKGLIGGRFKSNIADLVIGSRLEGGFTQRINIGMEKVRPLFFRSSVNDLDLQLAKEIPIDLYIDAGSVDMDLDLTDIELKGLDIDAGASNMNIIISRIQDRSKIFIDAGASDVKLILPKGIGAELIIDAGASSKDLQEFEPVDSGHYISENFENSEIQIEIHFNVAASNIQVDWAK